MKIACLLRLVSAGVTLAAGSAGAGRGSAMGRTGLTGLRMEG
ncbi:hypothetical protein ACQP2K_18885 [Microbispora siamensis]